MAVDIIQPLMKILPVLFLIPLGYALRKVNIVRNTLPKDLNSLFINVALPASLFIVFSSMSLSVTLLYLPIAGFLVNTLMLVAGFCLVRFLKLHKKIKNIFLLTLPVFATGTIAFPFFIAMFGAVKGLSIIALIEIGNIVFWNTVDRYLGFRLAKKKVNPLGFLGKLLKTPILWAVVLGLLYGYFNMQSVVVVDFITILANSTVFLIMLSLGVSLKFDHGALKKTFPVILTKTCLGLLIGFAVGFAFSLDDFSMLSILVYASVPASAVTFAFAAEQHLGKHFEAELLSIAFPLGALLVPALVIFREWVVTPAILLVALPMLGLGLFLMRRWD